MKREIVNFLKSEKIVMKCIFECDKLMRSKTDDWNKEYVIKYPIRS